MSNEAMPTGYDQAQIAAILELYMIEEADGAKKDDFLSSYGLGNFEVVDVGQFDRDIYQETYPNNVLAMKAITVKNTDTGELYVHFNGTGDGNWVYNSAAYQDGPPSAVQNWSLYYFNEMVDKYSESGDIYVSGHSQGGNNAQFVTMRSAYGERITQCISLDGPGFSNRFVEDTKNLYGEEYFEQQRQKIYGYNGKSDFVSPLGQQNIIPEGHTRYLDYGNVKGPAYYHAIEGLFAVDAEGNILVPPQLKGLYNGDGLDDSDFRKLVVAIADQVKEMPQDQQERAAEIVMKLCENMGGGEDILAELTERDLTDLKTMLVPLLIETVEKNPDLVLSALRELDTKPELVLLAEKFLGEFNGLSSETRREGLEFLFEYVVIKDGNIDFKWPVLLADAWEEIRCNPANAWAIVQKYHLDDVLVDYMKEHPIASVAAVTFATCIMIFFPELMWIAVAIADIASMVVHLIELAQDVMEFVVNVIKAIQETFKKIQEWFYKNSAGYKYSQQYSYLRVDTDALRNYAARLENINKRLQQLDHDMDHLYPQVRLQDLISAFSVNWSTSWSLTLGRAAWDLRATADEFDAAENKACGYLGG